MKNRNKRVDWYHMRTSILSSEHEKISLVAARQKRLNTGQNTSDCNRGGRH